MFSLCFSLLKCGLQFWWLPTWKINLMAKETSGSWLWVKPGSGWSIRTLKDRVWRTWSKEQESSSVRCEEITLTTRLMVFLYEIFICFCLTVIFACSALEPFYLCKNWMLSLNILICLLFTVLHYLFTNLLSFKES